MTGKVAICSLGRLGVITGSVKAPWGRTWVGIGLDGNGLWMSTRPHVISDSLEQYTQLVASRHPLRGELSEWRWSKDDELPKR